MSYTKAQRAEAVRYLQSYDWTKERLLIVIKSVSRSGMYRRMEVYSGDGTCWLTRSVGAAIGWPVNEVGIGVSGCGMDMALHLADTLTWALFGEDRRNVPFSGNGGGCIAWRTL